MQHQARILGESHTKFSATRHGPGRWAPHGQRRIVHVSEYAPRGKQHGGAAPRSNDRISQPASATELARDARRRCVRDVEHAHAAVGRVGAETCPQRWQEQREVALRAIAGCGALVRARAGSGTRCISRGPRTARDRRARTRGKQDGGGGADLRAAGMERRTGRSRARGDPRASDRGPGGSCLRSGGGDPRAHPWAGFQGVPRARGPRGSWLRSEGGGDSRARRCAGLQGVPRACRANPAQPTGIRSRRRSPGSSPNDGSASSRSSRARRQPRATRAAHRDSDARHDGAWPDRSNAGANVESGRGASSNRAPRPGARLVAAPCCERVRARPLASCTFFSYGAAEEIGPFVVGDVNRGAPKSRRSG
jgi:hypothetical protein